MRGTVSHVVPAFLDHLDKNMIMVNFWESEDLVTELHKRKTGLLDSRELPWQKTKQSKKSSYILLQLVTGGIDKHVLCNSIERWHLETDAGILRTSPNALFSFINPLLYPVTVINHSCESSNVLAL